MATQDSKKQIVKATGIVGSGQIITIIIRIIRTKIIAVLLGPEGVGIAGLYQSTADLVRRSTGLGLDFSAVRNVAEANASGDRQQIGWTITIVRRWVWLTGLLGLSTVIIFRNQFSRFAFNDSDHAFEFVILSAVPLFTAVGNGQMALLRGVRRIGDFARANVLGAAGGLVATVPLYYFLGTDGIVPAISLTSLALLIASWYFVRKIEICPLSLSLRETVTGGAGMIRLGLFTAFTGLAMTGTMYIVRIFISGKMGVDGVGQFQAAWNMSAIYVRLVLNSMGADYFPRLSAINQDNNKIRKLVNEQTEIALLLSGSIIVGVICFIDIIVKIFYSNEFGQSSDILLWQTVGNLLKVISWPMGFIFLAKGKGAIYVLTELLWNGLFFGLIWTSWNNLGIESVGVAFLVGYFVMTCVTYFICWRICDFHWSAKNKKLVGFYLLLTVLSFFNVKFQFYPYWRLFSIGLLAVALIYTYKELRKIVDIKAAIIQKLKK